MRVTLTVDIPDDEEQPPSYELACSAADVDMPDAMGALVRCTFDAVLHQLLTEMLEEQPMGNLEVLTQIAIAEAKNVLVHEVIHATPVR